MALDIKIPPVGESINEVTLSRWIKKDGDHVEMDEAIAELESDKATFELTAEKAGILRTRATEGDTIAIGALVASIEEGEEVANPAPALTQAEPASAPAASAPSAPAKNETYANGSPSPAAAKLLAEKGLTAEAVRGTGRDGRITKEDALRGSLSSTETVPPPTIVSAVPAPAAIQVAAAVVPSAKAPVAVTAIINPLARIQRRERLSNMRKTVGRRLVAVKNETAMLTTFNEVDMQPIIELRAKYKDKFKEKYGVGLGFMSFFTKAVCEALKDFPAVNAMIDGDEIIYNDYADISIAVSAPKGLMVPVIRNAESMSFSQIEKTVVELAVKARDNKLSIEEMTGGNFSITNGGIFGSMLSTPILNPPQSAILGMHNIVERPVAINGQVVIRPIMYVALSYDHRIIDGRESVSFLVKVKQLLEDPSRLLLGL